MTNDYLECCTRILQGLLSSGHYTSPPDTSEEMGDIKKYDHGKDWKSADMRRRQESYAILSALDLADELFDALKIPIPNDKNLENRKGI